MLSAAGLPANPQQHRDGADLLPLLRGERFNRGPIYWHYPHYSNQGGTPSSAIRDGEWKLVHYFEDGRSELFHIVTDLGEQADLAGVQPEIAADLTDKLHNWVSSVASQLPQPNPQSEPYSDLAGHIEEQEASDPPPGR